MAIEKRHVRMRNKTLIGVNENGDDVFQDHEANDYVPVDILDAYLTDARTRWSLVQVINPDVHTPGPAGDEGDTHYPAHLSDGHPHQGKTVNHRGEVVA